MTEALVLAGHGSRRDAEAGGAVYDHAIGLRDEGWFDEVRVAFWKELPSLREVVRSIESDEAFVVPMLTSKGYFADRVFPRELGLDGDPVTETPVRYTEPVGTHPMIADVIAERVGDTTADRGSTGVVVVGHGTDRHAASDRATRRHVARLAESGGFAEVVAGFLDQDPTIESALADVSGDRVVVVPCFLANSTHTSVDVPAAFGHPGIGETAEIGGRPVHYTAAVGTDPGLLMVVRERARASGAVAAAGAGGATTPAETRTAERLERSAPTRWGQLRVEHSATGFALLHHDDASADGASLASLSGPSALRRYVRRDDDGGYRPLTGQRTLPTGWLLEALDRRQVIDALEAVYPGSVRAHDAHCRDDLEVTPGRQEFDRHGGMYADLAALPDEEVAAVSEAVCGTCVRDRQWSIAGEPAPESSPGSIPCPAACPFLRSAARAVQQHGPGEASEADVARTDLADPANRFRVRYAEALDRHTERPTGCSQ